jgi:hypothetical protein
MSADSGVSGQLPEHTRLVLVILLIAVVLNLLYPGEVFFQSRYLLVLGAVSACAVVLFRGHWRGAANATFRHAALAFLPLVGMVPSLIWTTNQDRSQEAFLLFFSYSCLLFSLWRCKFRSEALCASLLTLVAVVMVVGVQALYQHFVGLDALKAELMQRTNMDGDFRAALLARTHTGGSGYDDPADPSGTPAHEFCSLKFAGSPASLDHNPKKPIGPTGSSYWDFAVNLGAGTDSKFWRMGLSLLFTRGCPLRMALPEWTKGRLDHQRRSPADACRIMARMDLIQTRLSIVEPERR